MREETQDTDIVRGVATLKWKFAGHSVRLIDEKGIALTDNSVLMTKTR